VKETGNFNEAAYKIRMGLQSYVLLASSSLPGDYQGLEENCSLKFYILKMHAYIFFEYEIWWSPKPIRSL
jgi:hypothetical protein